MSRVRAWVESRKEALLDCRVFTVERSQAQSPLDGSKHEFYRLRAPDWAQIVPITRNDEVVLVRQYRHGSQDLALEIPAGQVDLGETSAAAAARECLEETGYLAKDLKLLGDTNPNPALFANRLHGYYALDVEPSAEIANTVTEQTEVVLVPRGELGELLRSGRIDHALCVMTLWQFLDLDPR